MYISPDPEEQKEVFRKVSHLAVTICKYSRLYVGWALERGRSQVGSTRRETKAMDVSSGVSESEAKGAQDIQFHMSLPNVITGWIAFPPNHEVGRSAVLCHSANVCYSCPAPLCLQSHMIIPVRLCRRLSLIMSVYIARTHGALAGVTST